MGCASTSDALKRNVDDQKDTTVVVPNPAETSIEIDTQRNLSSEGVFQVLTAEVYRQEGNLQESRRAFHQALVFDPTSSHLHTELAESYLRTNETLESRRHASQAIMLDSTNVNAWLAQGAAEMADKSFEEAESSFHEALRLEPGHRQASRFLSRLYLDADRLQDAVEVIETWMLHDRSATDGYLVLARLLAARGDFSRAVSYVESALSRDRESPEALELGVRLALAGLNDRQALELSHRLRKARGDSQPTRYTLLITMLINADYTAALNLAHAWHAEDPRVETALMISSAFRSAGELDRAEEFLRELTAEPYSESVVIELVELALMQGDAAAAMMACKKKSAERSEAMSALCIDAYRLAKKTEGAFLEYKKARRAYPESRRVLSSGVALLTSAEGSSGSHRTLVEKGVIEFIDRHPNDMSLIDMQLQCLEDRGAKEEAEKLTSLIERDYGGNDEALMVVARFRERNGRAAEAANSVIGRIESDEASIDQLNFAAFVVADNDLPMSEARTWARQAFLAMPTAGFIADTLGWVLIRSGEVDEGVKYLRRALQLSPFEPEIYLHLAIGLEKSGDVEGAKALYASGASHCREENKVCKKLRKAARE